MRKLSIIVLVAVLFVGVLVAVFHMRHHAQPTITGVGVLLTVRDHALEIMDVLSGSPAAKAGLHRGLIIQQIDGTDIIGKPLAESVAMTRGPVGSKVQFEVIDPAKSETNIVAFTRETITLPAGAGSPPITH
jgi:carboxyl-terminal processing protease